MIQAAQGDCIWIEYGKGVDSLHRILIDGGTSGTYKKLKNVLRHYLPMNGILIYWSLLT